MALHGLLALFAVVQAALPSVVVTGATGRTGSVLYHLLKSSPSIGEVKALVTDASKAKQYLNCTKCDASEGIFIGDVTKPSTLTAAFTGVDSVAIAVGAPGGSNSSVQKQIDYLGVVNQIEAFQSNAANYGVSNLRVALISSMGTTFPNPPPFMGGTDLFWKLNAEAFLASCGIPSVIIKPCGLGSGAGGNATLLVGHNDEIKGSTFADVVNRADVAAVMATAMEIRTSNLRFDLCGKQGQPANDPKDVLKAAAFPWQR